MNTLSDWQQKPIYLRADGSYVITYHHNPCHVPDNEEFAALFAEVNDYVQQNPQLLLAEEFIAPVTEDEPVNRLVEIQAALAELDAQYLTPRVLANLALGDDYALAQYDLHEHLAEALRQEYAQLMAQEN